MKTEWLLMCVVRVLIERRTAFNDEVDGSAVSTQAMRRVPPPYGRGPLSVHLAPPKFSDQHFRIHHHENFF